MAVAVCCWLLALLGTSMALQHHFSCISIELQWHFNGTPTDVQCSFNRTSRELQQNFHIISTPPKQIFKKITGISFCIVWGIQYLPYAGFCLFLVEVISWQGKLDWRKCCLPIKSNVDPFWALAALVRADNKIEKWLPRQMKKLQQKGFSIILRIRMMKMTMTMTKTRTLTKKTTNCSISLTVSDVRISSEKRPTYTSTLRIVRICRLPRIAYDVQGGFFLPPPPNLTMSQALYKFLYLENFRGGQFKL